MTAMGAAQVRVSILAVGLLWAAGCERKDQNTQPEEVGEDIVCSQLYQGSDSLADALAFIEVPADRMESSLTCVGREGGLLANPRQLAFANDVFGLRKSRDVKRFKSLLSDATRKELDEPDNNKQMVHYVLREIEDGTFLYGQWDFTFFATFHALTQDDLAVLSKHVSFAQPPTHAITFYHFHKPNSMLIGTRNYLIQNGDSYRIVTETLLNGELPSAAEERESPEYAARTTRGKKSLSPSNHRCRRPFLRHFHRDADSGPA